MVEEQVPAHPYPSETPESRPEQLFNSHLTLLQAEQLEEGLSDKEVAIAAVTARLHEKEATKAILVWRRKESLMFCPVLVQVELSERREELLKATKEREEQETKAQKAAQMKLPLPAPRSTGTVSKGTNTTGGAVGARLWEVKSALVNLTAHQPKSLIDRRSVTPQTPQSQSCKMKSSSLQNIINNSRSRRRRHRGANKP